MEKRPIQVGDLVVTEDGYYALVTEHLDYGVTVFRSNGLESPEWEGSLKQLPLRVNEDTDSCASFIEALKPRVKHEQNPFRKPVSCSDSL
jgi:hypothetical protein